MMKHLQMNFFLAMLCLCIVVGCAGCAHIHPNKDNRQVNTTDNNTVKNNQTTQKAAPAPRGSLTFAFSYPVVQVNNQRVAKVDPLAEEAEQINVSYAPNTTNSIVIRFLDSEGEEREIIGKIRVYDHNKQTRAAAAGKTISVAPDEDVYERILRAGIASQLKIHAELDNLNSDTWLYDEGDNPSGPVLAEMWLGSRKKKNKGLEFRFREGIISSVNDKLPPIAFEFPENSRQRMNMTIDDGLIKLAGVLEVYNNTEYTRLAPVWIDLDESTQERLRGLGGKASIALYVPSAGNEAKEDESLILSVKDGKDPVKVGKKLGTVVAVLRLRKVSSSY